MTFKYASFLIPIIDGQIYLAQRGTEPHKGLYGAVGGKSDPQKAAPQRPRLVKLAGGHLKLSFSDFHAHSEGREYTLDTAIREFCEEMFSAKKYPVDFGEEDITEIVNLGWIGDRIPPFPAFINQFYFGKLNRKDYSPSKREITDFKPIKEIKGEQIFPIAQAALIQLSYLTINEKYFKSMPELMPYKEMKLHEQIPEMKVDKMRPGNMHGMVKKYLDDQFL